LALHALAELKEGENLEVWVDNDAAVENLKRMAAQKGRAASVQKESDFWRVFIGEGAQDAPQNAAQPGCGCTVMGADAVVAIGSDTMGRGSEELGHALLKSFLYALAQLETPPRTMLFFNGGAKWTVEGSPSLEDLRELENRGTEVLTCGTCLDYYGLKEKLAVGSVTNMYRIAEILTQADRLVNL
ncbi:sulfurtransferase-like selenium metabolism protein YedF, partial [Flintibacter sp.]|uniref:sulfurtransferase-like selenium metabolism protein YedF n=1 Tax=Flintibacter sp. TaxID=1918624 RepID=UPI003D1008A9